jgi:hypothetical protein
MWRGQAMAVMMGVAMMGMTAVGVGWNHPKMLYYNITSAKALRTEPMRNRSNEKGDSFRRRPLDGHSGDGPKDQTRNLEIPGSVLRTAPE